jgi:hypothetical protein
VDYDAQKYTRHDAPEIIFGRMLILELGLVRVLQMIFEPSLLGRMKSNHDQLHIR